MEQASQAGGQPLTAALGVAPRLRGLVLLAAVRCCCFAIATALILIIGLSLLLSSSGVRQLPALYLAAGLVLLVLSVVQRLVRRGIPAMLAPLLLVLVAGAAWLGAAPVSSWPVPILVVAGLVLQLLAEPALQQVGHQLQEARQEELLLEMLAACSLGAFSLSSLALPVLLQLLDPGWLLLLGGVVLLLAALIPAGARLQAAEPDTAGAPGMRQPGTVAGTERSLLLCLAYGLLVLLASLAIDLTFLSRLAARYSHDHDLTGLVTCLGGLLGAAGLVTLACRPVAVWMLRRRGAPTALISIPPLLAVGALLALVLSATGAAAVFVLVALLKLSDLALRGSAVRAALPTLVQPLAVARSGAAAWLLHWLVPAVAAVVAGAALLPVTTSDLAWEAPVLAATVLLLLLCLGLGLASSGGYRSALQRALARRRLEGILDHWFSDETALQVVRDGLSSDHPAKVVHCLDLLLKRGDPAAAERLPELLRHPSAEVRREVLAQLGPDPEPAALQEVRYLLESDPSPVVRGAAARTLCAAGEVYELDQVARLLGSRHPEIRQGALSGLLSSGDIEPMMIAGEELKRLLQSPDPEDRMLAAEVLGALSDRGHRRALLQLLEDREARVRRVALQAPSLVETPQAWPAVIANLAQPGCVCPAAATLVAVGEPAVPGLIAAWQSEENRDVRFRLLSILQRIGSAQANEFLLQQLQQLGDLDIETRHRLLAALAGSGVTVAEPECKRVNELLEGELAAAAWNLAALRDTAQRSGAPAASDPATGAPVAASQVLQAALEREVGRNRVRVVLLTSLVGPASLAAHELVPAELRPGTEALLDHDASVDQRLVRLGERYPQEEMDLAARLEALATRPPQLISAWTRACALFQMADVADSDQESAVTTLLPLLTDREPLIRETALWLLTRIDPAGARRHVQGARSDPVASVAAMARHLAEQLAT